MKWSKYEELNADGKAFFRDEDGAVALAEKRWDSSTGEELSDHTRKYSLDSLESMKDICDNQIKILKLESDGLKKAIADFKKV